MEWKKSFSYTMNFAFCLRELRSQTFSLCSGIGSGISSDIDYISKSVIEPVEITVGEKLLCGFKNNLDSYGMT